MEKIGLTISLLLYWNILTNMVSLGFSNQYVSLFQDRRIRCLNHLSKIFSLLRTCPRSVSVCVFVHCSFFFYGALGFSALCMSRCVKLSWEVSLCRRVNEGPEVSTQCWGIPRIAKLCYFCCVHPNKITATQSWAGLYLIRIRNLNDICLIWKTSHHNRSWKNKLLCHGFAIVLDSFLLMIQN